MTNAQTSDALILHIGDKSYSSWSLRPWLVLRHAGLAFEEVLIRLRQPGTKAAIAAVSPSGKLPCLHHGALRLGESLAIAEYAAELAPLAGLWPADRATRAKARAVATEMHAGFAALRQTRPMDIPARHPAGTGSTPESDADVARVVAIWTEARAAHRAEGPYLFGPFTIADAMFAPVVTRFVTYGVDPGGAALDYMRTIWRDPHMAAWIAGAYAEQGLTAPREPDF